MKTKIFWLAIVLGTILTIFTACEKGEDELPEIVNSEVLDRGLSNDVTVTGNETDGTTLSYESWIKVQQEVMTRSTVKDKVISVTLNNLLTDVKKDVEYYYVDFGTPETSISYKMAGYHKSQEEDYVIVYDSVMVYTITYPCFSFSYELMFQVPVFYDGVTRHTMPYYRYENIRSGKASFTDMDSRVIDGKAYSCKKFNHSILINFNGQEYEVKADFNLIRYLSEGDQPYLVRSEVKDKTITAKQSDNLYSSILTMTHTWSNNEKTDTEYEALLELRGESLPFGEIQVKGDIDNLELKSISIESSEEGYGVVENYVTRRTFRDICTLNFGDFSVPVHIIRMEASYDDGVTQTEFLSHKITPENIKIVNFEFDFFEAQGTKEFYFLKLTIEVTVGGLSTTGYTEGMIVLN